MPQRTLGEDEFNQIKQAVLQGAPSGLSEAEFYRYVGPKFAEAIGVAENSAPQAEGSAVGRFLSGAGEMLNPVTAATGIYNAVRHPLDTLTGIASSAKDQIGQASDLAGQGRYVEAAGHAVAGAIPVLGPVAAGIGEQIGGGDIAGGLGKAAGMAAPMVAGPVLAKTLPKRVGPLVSSKLNPAEAAAVEFGERQGIPIDLATKTGSPTARAMQKRTANSIGGEGTAERMIADQEKGLARVGGELTEQTNTGGFVSPEQAGAGVSEGVRNLIGSMGKMADDSYGKLRKIEADPRNLQKLPTAPNGSRAYTKILQKMESGGAKPSVDELYAMRQIEAELDATPFSKRMLRQADKGGGSYEPVEGVGGAGAPVYHEIGQVMTDGGDLTRGQMQANIAKTLETGEWNAASRGALAVAKKRLGMEIPPTGPSLGDRPLLGSVEDVSLPVALSQTKKALEPLYNRLKRESELVPLQGDKGRALVALDRLLDGPEHASVSVVDAALGDLKSMARSELPELKTQGQGLAGQAVKVLDKAVRDATIKAGPEALSALEEGRAATVAKYQAADVFDQLRAEPVQTFRQMTAPKDSGINLLRQVREMAPAKMPDVARAYLEDLMGTATAEGGFSRSAKLQADWQKLGPETKRLLFPSEGQIADLDHFFLLAKRLAENPNPSGTAHNLTVFNVGGTVGTWPLAKLLYTERGVRALTQGMSISLNPSRASTAARQAAQLALAKAAREVGVDLSAVPALAGQDAPSGQK